ncbi:MAG: hypothetical protein QHC79_09525 [Pseudosphingobacterium sp.]|nr:hypothetical protein [Pseudosphingobacterium sp.]
MTDERKAELRTILSRNALAQDWTRYLLDKLRASIHKRKIGVSQDLIRSFEREFKYSGGAISEILVKFLFYGRFVDMGVGRGLKAYERMTNKQNKSGARVGAAATYNKRQPKKWLNKTTAAQTYRLVELLEENLAENATQNLRELLATDITTTI